MKDEMMQTSQMRLRLLIICLLMFFFLVSCSSTSTLSTRASRVRLVSALQAHQVEAECDFLANVRGSHPYGGCCMCWGITGCWTYNDKTLNELLDNAGELGGTHMFVNLGNGQELRGEVYSCAYCELIDGRPDEDYCEGYDGEPERDFCDGPDGEPIGEAHCKGAEGESPVECLDNGGKWIRAIDEATCEAEKGNWIMKSKDRTTCTVRGGKWLPKAKNKISCEAKGGRWVLNQDVLRYVPSLSQSEE